LKGLPQSDVAYNACIFGIAISSVRADRLMIFFSAKDLRTRQAEFPELTCDRASETGKDIDIDDWFIQGRRNNRQQDERKMEIKVCKIMDNRQDAT
jgi:hypothetical protein